MPAGSSRGRARPCRISKRTAKNNPIVGWDVNPGDALIFSAWTLHWAPGNSSLSSRRAAISTRWLGDDAVWFPHPGADPTIQEEDIHIEPGQPPADEQVFPRLWPPG